MRRARKLHFIALFLILLGYPVLAQTLDQSLSKDPEYRKELYKFITAHPEELDLYSAFYNPVHTFHIQDRPMERFMVAYLGLQQGIAPSREQLIQAPPSNSRAMILGNSWIAHTMKRSLKKTHAMKSSEIDHAVELFFDAMDLRGAGGGFSGYIFFDDFLQTFQDREWIDYALKLERKLDFLLQHEVLDSPNLFQLATEITGGDARKSVRLLGLLLSRDITVHHYFKYFKVRASNTDFNGIVRVNQLVRTYAEWLQWKKQTDVDAFTYPNPSSGITIKNYYFWSQAYLSLKLLDQGLEPQVIETLVAELTIQYKWLRRYVSRLGLSFFSGVPIGELLGLNADVFRHLWTGAPFDPISIYPIWVAVAVVGTHALLIRSWPIKKFLVDREEVLKASLQGSRLAAEICNDTFWDQN